MSRSSREAKKRLHCRRAPRRLRPAALALALALAAVPLAAHPVQADGYRTAEYRSAEMAGYRSSEVEPVPSLLRKLFDAVLLRPLQLGQLVLSAVLFVPAYPVSLLFGGGEDVLELCITEPTDRLFRKPLGDL